MPSTLTHNKTFQNVNPKYDVRVGLSPQDTSKLVVEIVGKESNQVFARAIVPVDSDLARGWETGEALVVHNAVNNPPSFFQDWFRRYSEKYPSGGNVRVYRIARLYRLTQKYAPSI